jgi:type III secretion protein J
MRRTVMVLGGFLLLVGLGSGCRTRIQHGLDEREANRVVAALREVGVEANKIKEEGRGSAFAVDVPRGQETRAIRTLLEQDLPRRRQRGFGEVYGKASLLPSATEQRARYVYALSGELAATLEASDGVLEARVHLVLPERDPLALREPTTERPRASVLLRVRPDVATLSADEVRRLVSGGVRDLEPAQVSVVIRPAATPRAGRPVPALAHVGPLSVTEDSRSTLLGLLAGVLGLLLVLGAALVFVAVRLGRVRRTIARSEAAGAADVTDGGRPSPTR